MSAMDLMHYEQCTNAHTLHYCDVAKNQWYNLLLEEQLVILPHRGTANIQAMLCNNENISQDVYAGFEIEHVEIRPITMRAETQGKHNATPCGI